MSREPELDLKLDLKRIEFPLHYLQIISDKKFLDKTMTVTLKEPLDPHDVTDFRFQGLRKVRDN